MTNQPRSDSKLTKWTIISFLLGTLLGSGSIWQWKHATVEAQKQELDRVMATTELRQKEADQYERIINLSNEYIIASAQYSKNSSPEISNEISRPNSHLELMKDDFNVLEENLALLERRQPRTINLVFIPPQPPTGLTGTMH